MSSSSASHHDNAGEKKTAMENGGDNLMDIKNSFTIMSLAKHNNNNELTYNCVVRKPRFVVDESFYIPIGY